MAKLLDHPSLSLREVHPDNRQLVQENRKTVPGYQRYEYRFMDDEENERMEVLWLSNTSAITQTDVKHAHVDPTFEGCVHVTLTQQGGQKFTDFTASLRLGQDRIAVLVNDQVKVAPIVQAVLGRNFQINGFSGPGEARAITKALNHPFPCQLHFIEES